MRSESLKRRAPLELPFSLLGPRGGHCGAEGVAAPSSWHMMKRVHPATVLLTWYSVKSDCRPAAAPSRSSRPLRPRAQQQRQHMHNATRGKWFLSETRQCRACAHRHLLRSPQQQGSHFTSTPYPVPGCPQQWRPLPVQRLRRVGQAKQPCSTASLGDCRQFSMGSVPCSCVGGSVRGAALAAITCQRRSAPRARASSTTTTAPWATAAGCRTRCPCAGTRARWRCRPWGLARTDCRSSCRSRTARTCAA
jgi:hypothetical protein